MATGTWAPPTPEYLTAPGYETYAPTAAYAYSPTGGDWSSAYPGYGYGGGGGGQTSGDFGGGADTSTIGGLLSVASLLGGANSLSSTLTGKSLLEHAGIKNPFENLFSSGSSGDGALPSSPPNPISNFFSPEATKGIVGNTPLDRIQNIFGSGPMAQREALTQALHPTGGIGDIAGLKYQDVGAGLPGAPPGGMPTAGPYGPQFGGPGIDYGIGAPPGGTAPLSPVQVQQLPPSGPFSSYNIGEPFNYPSTGEFVMPAQPAAPPVNLNLPTEVFNPGTGEFAYVNDIAGFNDAGQLFTHTPSATPADFAGQFQGTPTAGPYGPNPAFTEAALNTIMPGYGTTLGAASAAAGMSPALTSAYMTGAIPEFAGASFAAPGAGAGGLGAMGAAGPLALAAGAYALMKMRADASKDPTISTRRAQGLEKTLNTGGIGALAEFAYNNPDTMNLLDQVALDGPGSVNTAPFGTAPTSGGTQMIAWSDPNKAKIKAAAEMIKAAHSKGQQVLSVGDNTGLHGAVPSYADAMSGATWNAQNDPFGRRELEAASMKAQGYGNYVPSGRNLAALQEKVRMESAGDDGI